MKEPCEKPKMVTETIDIGMLVAGSSVLIAQKDGGSLKEPYVEPEMVTETVDIGMLIAGGSPSALAQNQSMFGLCLPCEDGGSIL